MARIIVTTDDGRVVDSCDWTDGTSIFATQANLNLTGHVKQPMGWLGRALQDAAVVQAGGDPERPSEKAMRLAMQERQA